MTTSDAQQGWGATSLDELEGSFKLVRPALGLTAFGMNARVMKPGASSPMHYHELQQEVFFVHRGRVEITLDGVAWQELGEGSIVRIDAGTAHAFRNASDEPAVMLMMGGRDGVVDGDAHFV